MNKNTSKRCLLTGIIICFFAIIAFTAKAQTTQLTKEEALEIISTTARPGMQYEAESLKFYANGAIRYRTYINSGHYYFCSLINLNQVTKVTINKEDETITIYGDKVYTSGDCSKQNSTETENETDLSYGYDQAAGEKLYNAIKVLIKYNEKVIKDKR